MPSEPNSSIDTTAENTNNENQPSTSTGVVKKPAKTHKFIVKVTALERVGNSTNQRENPIVIFDLFTDVPAFRKQQHRGVKKTADEFKELFRYLVAAVQETFVPSLPATCSSYGPNTDEDRHKTMKNYQEWLERIAADPLLLKNEEVAFFVQSDFGTYSPINNPPTQPASGLKRKTLKQLAPPYDEVLELAEFRPLVKSVHRVSQEVQSKLSKVSKQRRLLSQEETALGQGFTALQNDTHAHSGLYKRFGRVLAAAGDVDSVESTLEVATFADAMGWLVKDTYVVKEALTNRHLIMRELLQAQQSSRGKQEHARKLRAKRDASPLKVDEALRALRAATLLEQELTAKQRLITNNMLSMRSQWLQWYESFVTSAIKEFTLRKIEYERKKLTLLERVRHDVRRADNAGGLSRLGREAHPPSLLRSPPRNSQGLEGDDWAGDQRRRSSLLSQHDSVTNTDFDRVVTADEQQTLNPTVTSDPTAAESTDASGDNAGGTGTTTYSANGEQDINDTSLDARNAASLLGLATF
ncbi:hypothetical protein ZYGR_0N04690 [Zygosaccharomyces rouxii]|uniref:Vacuolar protein sorting-associated protein 17 n=1 Tax=Zygosaccharomyces rouxii TaxID=4956 RepID=A0A1Q3A042_ZYGRO|nr:hypothetical protein ZYGR_0N04690 [Zygosaccharomyces rouxii]